MGRGVEEGQGTGRVNVDRRLKCTEPWVHPCLKVEIGRLRGWTGMGEANGAAVVSWMLIEETLGCVKGCCISRQKKTTGYNL